MLKNKKHILIVGGAGYIGSHANKLLNSKGYDTIVLDNLTYGHESAVKWGKFILGDVGDRTQLDLIFNQHNIEAVMHFSAFAYVGESVSEPKKYYNNNVVNTIVLLDAMVHHNVKKFIFSSTCATFGEPTYTPVDEIHPQTPMSPYGRSKLMIEQVLKDYETAYDIKHTIFRYFNACGADTDCEIGEHHDPETHIIPLILDVAMGKRKDIKIFGADYPTNDGTCVRDYIHVSDLADAHLLGLEFLIKGNTSNDFNLGNGRGFSVKELIDVSERITGKKIKSEVVARRKGDPAIVIGSSKKALTQLKWKPKFDNIESIIETAWNWHKKVNKL